MLSDSEILAIIIGSGTKRKNALEIANEIITKDESNIGFSFLTQYSIEELMKFEGIGKVKAVYIKAICEFARRLKIGNLQSNERITTPEQMSKVFMLELQDKKQEMIKTAIIDSKNRVIKVITNSIGRGNTSFVDIKDLLSAPIKMGAPKIAVAHNHPSGDITPSREDIDFTHKLNDACKLLGINLLDHLIIRKQFFL